MKHEKLWNLIESATHYFRVKDAFNELNARGILKDLVAESASWVSFVPEDCEAWELGLRVGPVILGYYKDEKPVIYWVDRVSVCRPVSKREYGESIHPEEYH